MKKKLTRVLAVVFVLSMLIPVSVLAETATTTEEFGGNTMSSGSAVKVDGARSKDIFAFGNLVEVDDSQAIGNIFAAGRDVDVSGVMANADFFVAGQEVSISGAQAAGNTFAAGENIEIKDSYLDGLYAVASTVAFSGEASYVSICGTTVYFDGVVDGDVYLECDNVSISDDTVINGKLTIESKNEPSISDAVSLGSYEYKEVVEEENTKAEKVGFVAKFISKISSLMFWIPAMIIVGLVLSALFGRHLDEAAELVVVKPLEYLAYGAISWFAIPIALVIVAITVVGLPIAAIGGTCYMVLIWIGLTFTGASLGRLAFKKLHPMLASVIGVAILEFVRIIPSVGLIIGIVADMYTLGYVVRSIIISAKTKKEASEIVDTTASEEFQL